MTDVENAPDRYRLHCGKCRFFTGAPAAIERAIPGLNILSSAFGSVRADTGPCPQFEDGGG
jgi:hypothetical protein